MEGKWLKYTLNVAADWEDQFVAEVLDSSYTLGWVEPQIDVLVTDNGYDFAEKRDVPVIAYLFEPMEKLESEHVQRLNAFLQPWSEKVSLHAIEQVKEENDSWKEEFKPTPVGDWLIAPTWTPEEQLTGKKNILWIDPGAAFGSGYHGTTQDIMLFLQELDLIGKKIFDIGTGSGILAVFAALLGAEKPIHAIDINAESDYQVELNLANNQLTADTVKLVIGDPLLPELREQLPINVDLVIVNIGGDEDIAMLPVVQRAIRSGGMVILSGIVEWNREKVEHAYQAAGFSIKAERKSEEWITLIAELCDN